MEVHVHRAALAGFHRRALRRYPKEYIESLWGVHTKRRVSIVEFRPVEHTATRKEVLYDDDVHSERDGRLRCLGVIHTHPGEPDVAPSEHDWTHSRDVHEVVTGICGITKRGTRRRCRTHFFLGNALCDTKLK